MTLHKAENVNVQNKVVLTQNEAKGIESALSNMDKETIVKVHAKRNDNWSDQDYVVALNGMPLDTLIIALYRPEDITIEQTVEEQLLEKYNEYSKSNNGSLEYGYKAGLLDALNIIGMKVKGINA